MPCRNQECGQDTEKNSRKRVGKNLKKVGFVAVVPQAAVGQQDDDHIVHEDFPAVTDFCAADNLTGNAVYIGWSLAGQIWPINLRTFRPGSGRNVWRLNAHPRLCTSIQAVINSSGSSPDINVYPICTAA